MPEIKTTITIDVEPDRSKNQDWNRKSPIRFDSLFYGLEQLKKIYLKHEVPLVFFLSPEILPYKKAIEGILDYNAFEIGSHLHPEFVAPEIRKDLFLKPGQFACSDIVNKIEKEKICNLTNWIRKTVGIKPISYRAGRFGADIDTISSLKDLGYKIDSSVTPNIDWSIYGGPNFKNFPHQPYFISENNFCNKSNSGILEIPVTIGEKRFIFLPERWYFYNWLRPNISLMFEQKRLINQFRKEYSQNEIIYFNIMFHSNEMKNNCSPSIYGQSSFFQKLNQIISFLKRQGGEFYTLKEIYADFKKNRR